MRSRQTLYFGIRQKRWRAPLENYANTVHGKCSGQYTTTRNTEVSILESDPKATACLVGRNKNGGLRLGKNHKENYAIFHRMHGSIYHRRKLKEQTRLNYKAIQRETNGSDSQRISHAKHQSTEVVLRERTSHTSRNRRLLTTSFVSFDTRRSASMSLYFKNVTITSRHMSGCIILLVLPFSNKHSETVSSRLVLMRVAL